MLNADAPEHQKAIKEYNEYITTLLKRACSFHKIPFNKLSPETIKGEKKPLGVWDYEYTADFKTLRAKSYIIRQNGKYKITCAGVNSSEAKHYMHKKYGDDLFSQFTDGLYIPAGNTGKYTHTYLDDFIDGYVTDYKGKRKYFCECSAIHLEPCDFSISLSTKEFFKIMKGVKLYGSY